MLGNLIFKARKAKRLTQRDLAKHLGVKQPIIVHYEKNRRVPPPEQLEKLAKFLEKDLEYFTLAEAVESNPFDNAVFEKNLKEARTLSLRHKKTLAAVLKTVMELQELENTLRTATQRLPKSVD